MMDKNNITYRVTGQTSYLEVVAKVSRTSKAYKPTYVHLPKFDWLIQTCVPCKATNALQK